MYLVVGCPKCGAVRVAARGVKTTSCPTCGKRFKVDSAAVHFETDSPERARSAAALARAGDSIAIPDIVQRPAKPVKAASGMAAALAIAKWLSKDGIGFSEGAFLETAGEQGLKGAGAFFKKLRENAEIYEASCGRWLAVRRKA
ncbi:MAG: hypothetical protein HZB92_06625 [Euryarchaeota archaeon]|nr:hypothetical protein [Euryarchaeota archaeon]